MLDDLAKRYGASKTLTWASATRTPTPGAVISRRAASFYRATATSRRPSTAICSPMACQAASSVPATSCRGPPATSARTRSAKGSPPPLPAIRPKGLRTPRIWFARSTRMRTSCARVVSRERTRWLSTLLTATSRYQPVRTICARPRASLRSDLFSCRASAALACRASRQTTGRPSLCSSCQCQADKGPLSRPMRTTSGARVRMVAAIASGVEVHFPSQITLPPPSTTQTEVCSCETSNPTYCSIPALLSGSDGIRPRVQLEGTGPQKRHVNLGGAWRADPGRVGNRNELALCQVTLCRLPFPAGGDQPRGLAVLPLPAQPAHGRGDAGRARHHREPRERAAVGAQVRPGLRQPDPAAAACGRRHMAFG